MEGTERPVLVNELLSFRKGKDSIFFSVRILRKVKFRLRRVSNWEGGCLLGNLQYVWT